MIAPALRNIETALLALAEQADAEHPVDPFELKVLAKRLAAQAEMIEQEVVQDDEPPPEDAAPEPPSNVDLGAGSPGGSGPSIGGGGGGSGSRIGSRRGSGSKFGWYAAKVQSSIREALGRNPSTRSATMSLQVRVWADSNGRIIKAQLVGTSGNPAIDQSIRNQVLTGLQLPQPPPADMPMPINLRITARKPTS